MDSLLNPLQTTSEFICKRPICFHSIKTLLLFERVFQARSFLFLFIVQGLPCSLNAAPTATMRGSAPALASLTPPPLGTYLISSTLNTPSSFRMVTLIITLISFLLRLGTTSSKIV